MENRNASCSFEDRQSLLGLAFLALVVSLPFVAVQDLWSQEMSRLHRAAGMVFVVLAFLHIALNWSWIKNTFLRKSQP